MKSVRSVEAFVDFVRSAPIKIAASLGLAALMAVASAMAQDAKLSAEPSSTVKRDMTVMDGFIIHQSFDVGGHVADTVGSGAMYDTLVNIQSGPRFLNHTLEMHAIPGSKHPLYDTVYEGSTGYGGDPNDFTTLRISKGKIYDFQGMFRRDRQYFDYDLLGNPLIPAGVISNGYTFPQVQNAPHLFNTVRRMTDTNLTFLPIAKVSFRVGYSQNIHQGPSYSSIHYGADALLFQNWRNSTDDWIGAVDWKPLPRTTLTFEEHISHYKGDTNWQLAGLNLQLANGTPVSLGFDNATAPGAVSASTGCTADAGRPAILDSTTTPPTANPCVNGYVQYTRSTPTRTLFPTEEFRFQTAALKNIQINGRISYTGAKTNLPAYFEFFNGLESRVTTPAPAGATDWCTTSTVNGVRQHNDCLSTATTTGDVSGKRINTSADLGVVWELSKNVSFSDQYDFQNFRQPVNGTLSEVDQYSSSMLTAPVVTGAAEVTNASNFLGQKTQTNTFTAAWQAADWIELSVGYRYRARTIGYVESVPTEVVLTGRNYIQDIHEQGALFGLVLRPTREWRINSEVELGWADFAYVQTSPRQFQRYLVRTTYKPKNWATISGAFNDSERRDNVTLVNYLAHNRSISGAASVTPNEHLSLDVNYGYIDVFSQSVNCFDATVAPLGATLIPLGVPCGNAVNTAASSAAYYGTSYYDSPTQYASAGVVLTPIKQLRTSFGYRVSAVEGRTELLNPLAVPGSLQSKYQTPYGGLAWVLTKAWAIRGDYNYYGYGEGGPAGPTAPRNFHGNIYTLGIHYAY